MKKYKTDTFLKEFWRDNHRFADLFNTVIFQGRPVIKPEDLKEADTEVSGTWKEEMLSIPLQEFAMS